MRSKTKYDTNLKLYSFKLSNWQINEKFNNILVQSIFYFFGNVTYDFIQSKYNSNMKN